MHPVPSDVMLMGLSTHIQPLLPIYDAPLNNQQDNVFLFYLWFEIKFIWSYLTYLLSYCEKQHCVQNISIVFEYHL